MALSKVTYNDNQTVIHAQNLNAIQDEIIANAAAIATHTNLFNNNQFGVEYIGAINSTDTATLTFNGSYRGVIVAIGTAISRTQIFCITTSGSGTAYVTPVNSETKNITATRSEKVVTLAGADSNASYCYLLTLVGRSHLTIS